MPINITNLAIINIEKLILCFCSDIDATKTTKILSLNRKTINRYFRLFRASVFAKQTSDRTQLFGEIELDEAYFGCKRLRGVNMPQQQLKVFGVLQNADYLSLMG